MGSYIFENEPIDPEIDRLITLEDLRQSDKLQMIPSESICPPAVLATLATPFANKYAEGYPSGRMSRRERDRLSDVERYMGFHRRYGDRRYYKGTEYVNFIESIAQQRCAELFASEDFPASQIYVNVQPLSGGPANNAVYDALCNPGDTVMGLHLAYGGHLTHGSPFNRSGKNYEVHAYVVNEETGKLDYDLIRKQAIEIRPRILIAGASAYPWTIDWNEFRSIANEVGAYLLADISHPAGLVVGGKFPNPVGIADVTMFTTHKTMCGPRGAVLMSTDRQIAKWLDTAVFPGEQGGPHPNMIAAKAVAFRLAATDRFREMQEKIVENAAALAEGFTKRGMPLAFGGTNTHLCLIDLRELEWPDGIALTADIASNILDLCGITVNKNSLPGDATGVRPSGVRFGTVVLTQRGMGTAEMDTIAGLVDRVFKGIQPFRVQVGGAAIGRGKIEYSLMCEIREEVRKLTRAFPLPGDRAEETLGGSFTVKGERARTFLNQAAAANIAALEVGEAVRSDFFDPEGKSIGKAAVRREADGFLVDGSDDLRDWLSAVSDGYVRVVGDDLFTKVHGPVSIVPVGGEKIEGASEGAPDRTKVFYVGRDMSSEEKVNVGTEAKKVFEFKEEEGPEKKTPLWSWHKKAKARLLPFGGYSMPGWYEGTQQEHQAIRNGAGLFDVSHMGTLEASGPDAADFLDTVATNFVHKLEIGQSHYTYVLDVDGSVMDDIIIYRTGEEKYLVVVNASNQDKIWAWWEAVNNREVIIDRDAPEKVAPGPVTLRRLKDPSVGADQLVDIAFQGPVSLPVLQRLCRDGAERKALDELGKFHHTPIHVGDIEILASRTGYSGASVGFELFVHPDHALELWEKLLAEGEKEGVKPCGLASRDSTRTEAGFPLYGHELSGKYDMTPRQAGYGGFVKKHKPFFIGKAPLMAKNNERKQKAVRFQMKRKGIRMVRPDDPVVSRKGVCVGYVTSCVLIEKTQLGLALVDEAHTEEGSEFGVFILPKRNADQGEKARAHMEVGDRVLLHEDGVILPRFASF